MTRPPPIDTDAATEQTRRIESEASEWLATLYSGAANHGDEAAFRAWLHADPRHAATFETLNARWKSLDLIDNVEQFLPSMDERKPVSTGLRRRRTPRYLVAASLVAGVGIITVVMMNPKAEIFSYATPTGEVRTIGLPDDTQVTLGGGTHIDVRYTKRSRDIVLQSGRAYFDVARQPNRPLRVSTADTQVRVIGTQFDVRRGPQDVQVSVKSGLVEVNDATPGDDPSLPVEGMRLAAGERVRANLEGSVGPVENFDAERSFSWLTGRLSYADARLADIVADANRYRTVKIRILDAELNALLVTTSFRSNNSDEMLLGLQQTAPVVVERFPAYVGILSKKLDSR